MLQTISKPISLEELRAEAKKVFGEMVKAVVDIELELMVINGELHADEEALLMKKGSKQLNLWGINLYPDLFGTDDWLEYDSMINLRPSGGNNTRGVDSAEIRLKIKQVVDKLVQENI